MSPEAKFKIAHTGKNLIMVDSDDHSHEEKHDHGDEEQDLHDPILMQRKDFKILH